MKEKMISGMVAVLFVLLAAGLFYTQVVKFNYYNRLSRNNSIRLIPIDGPRGIIFDRNGKVLTSNRLSFDIAIIYNELRDRGKLAGLLVDVLKFSRQDVINALKKSGEKPYVPVTIAQDIGIPRALVLEEATIDTPGLVVQTKSKRSYRYDYAGAHVLGYLGEITEGELEDLKDYGYRSGDLLGRDGLEKYYEVYLRGVDGGTQIEVDSHGRQTRVLGVKEPSGGQDIYLTIDIELQKACDRLLGERSGAIVVMDPRNGEILALASHPSYDPNIFINKEDSYERSVLMNDERGRPMSDRALSGQYQPGSVFKIVTSSAALETRAIDLNTKFTCGGSYSTGHAYFNCWKERGHGPQNITDGIMNSCNVFFYNAAHRTGVDAIEAYARQFGFGRPTGIDLPDEAKGIVPGKAWKRAFAKDKWYEGDTLNYAIGEGYLLVTPIQVVNMTAVIANGGYLEHPFVVKKIGSMDIFPGGRKSLSIKKDTIQTIREGMFRAVNSEGGTGRRARVEGLAVAGKTGTAETGLGRTHAWFTGFAPYGDPKICIVVFLEHGGKGGLTAAEMARGVFTEARQLEIL